MPVLGCVVAENSIRFLGHSTHEHDEPHLVYVVAGDVVLTVDGVERALRTHEAVWMRPHVPHAVRVLDGAMILGPVLEDDAVPAGRTLALGVVPALVEVMTTVLVAAPSTAEEIRPFRRALGEVLRAISRPRFPVVAPTHPVGRRLAEVAVASPMPLADLARTHHLSTRQVQRIFSAETGYSFTRWRTRARLNLAAAHLLGGGEVKSAARLAGFETRAGLLRALSRETGLPTTTIALDPPAALNAA